MQPSPPPRRSGVPPQGDHPLASTAAHDRHLRPVTGSRRVGGRLRDGRVSVGIRRYALGGPVRRGPVLPCRVRAVRRIPLAGAGRGPSGASPPPAPGRGASGAPSPSTPARGVSCAGSPREAGAAAGRPLSRAGSFVRGDMALLGGRRRGPDVGGREGRACRWGRPDVLAARGQGRRSVRPAAHPAPPHQRHAEQQQSTRSRARGRGDEGGVARAVRPGGPQGVTQLVAHVVAAVHTLGERAARPLRGVRQVREGRAEPLVVGVDRVPRSFFAPTSSPSTTWSAASTTSSVSRRPLGKPAVSPSRTPAASAPRPARSTC